MSNKAAWIVEAGGKRLEVKEAPMPTAGPNEIVIKNHALAINPVDCEYGTYIRVRDRLKHCAQGWSRTSGSSYQSTLLLWARM